MKVHTSLDTARTLKPVVTTGIFDGVHLGHQKLFAALLAEAKKREAPALAITFWPHPYFLFHPDNQDFKLLMSLEEKQMKLTELGLDHLLVLPFDAQLAGLSARDFVKHILVDGLHIRHLVVGDDHRFGKNREGGYSFLKEESKAHGFGLSDLDSLTTGTVRISSTFIRSCLIAGDLASANRLLGFRYFIFGKVQRGNQIGSRIGYPTANIACCEEQKQIPQDGVYVVQVEWNGYMHGGMLNIGTRPTIEDSERKSIEVHIFGHQGDLYDEQLKVSFIRKIREEMRFNNLDELKEQLDRDRTQALEILNKTINNGRISKE